jgi:pyruvate,orthophosphate dikinase
VSFDPDRARQMAETTPVVLVRTELATDDISGLATAAGLLTRLGGRTSHAAVVARQLGTVCLVGCRDLRIDEAARSCMVGSTRIDEGDIVTLDADHGLIYAGAVPVVRQRPDADLAVLRQWRRQKPAAQPA